MTNYEKLINTLKEVFMLDKAELDFGIYRIMNQKRKDIEKFLEKDLVPQVQQVLADSLSIDKQALQKELDDAIKSAQALGADPETLPKVLDLKKQLGEAADMLGIENEVFSLLANFFKRYFDNGDFISMRRYKKDVYAIPYEGEEVKLHWANADQYYIKTSEYFKNYRFKLSDGKSVSFELIEANTEQNNNKAQDNKERRFALADADIRVEDNELIIPFTYEPKDKSVKQAPLLAEALEKIVPQITGNFTEYLDLISFKPTDKNSKRTLLEKHLNDYTARNTFDYFIHKDLGGFLTRELDFYIKNEVLFIDDLNTRDEQEFLKQLSKIKAIKKIGEKIIAFLAQIENFQKKLWLKKKMVVECNYCITLDRVPKELYPEILDNQAQIDEWIKLFAIDEIAATPKKDMFGEDILGFSIPLTMGFLNQNQFLVLDTAFFSETFKWKLIGSIENFDENCDGLLINSENFQALKLLSSRYLGKIKFTYIDPPYNTGEGDFPYKDNFQHSSWLSMMSDRLHLAKELMPEDGILFISLNDKKENFKESHRLFNLLDEVFGEKNYVEVLIWVKNTTHNDSKTYSRNHEYIFCYAKDKNVVEGIKNMFRQPKPGYDEVIELIQKLNHDYPRIENIQVALKNLYKDHLNYLKEEAEIEGIDWETAKSNDDWKGIMQYSKAEYRNLDDRYIEEKNAKQEQALIRVYTSDNPSWPNANSLTKDHKDSTHVEYRFYKPIHPITLKECPAPQRGWLWRQKPLEGSDALSFEKMETMKLIVYGEDEKNIPRVKKFLHKVDTDVAKSVIIDNTDGEKQLSNLMGERGTFPNPKPTTLIRKFLEQTTKAKDTIFDYFAGSGTTADSTINLQRIDGEKRKWLLNEMGNYFDLTTIKRIEKVIYSGSWKDGKPVNRDGISHCFKYMRLESYEDTLNNLVVKQTEGQLGVIENNPSFREGYMLNYMLEVETRDSLLNLEWFESPFNCFLNVTKNNELVPTKVDLVETFNYLIGLAVEHYAVPKEGYVVVTGKNLAGESILVVWRDCTQHNSSELNKFLEKSKYNPLDTEYDRIYVNGDNNVENLKTGDERWKVVLIEEEFKKRMFEEN